MTYQFRMFCVGVLLAGTAMLPLARADEWDKETTVTFNAAVQIPNQVLSPGTYVFKLADSQSNRHTVQIFTEDQSKLVATIEAIPAYRLEPTGVTLITFEELPTGTPEAVKRWFHSGDLTGVAFVYPDDQR